MASDWSAPIMATKWKEMTKGWQFKINNFMKNCHPTFYLFLNELKNVWPWRRPCRQSVSARPMDWSLEGRMEKNFLPLAIRMSCDILSGYAYLFNASKPSSCICHSYCETALSFACFTFDSYNCDHFFIRLQVFKKFFSILYREYRNILSHRRFGKE